MDLCNRCIIILKNNNILLINLCRTTAGFKLPHSGFYMMGVPAQWCWISGYHLLFTFSKEAGEMIE